MRMRGRDRMKIGRRWRGECEMEDIRLKVREKEEDGNKDGGRR